MNVNGDDVCGIIDGGIIDGAIIDWLKEYKC
jgi:hypothetical protein